MKEITRRLRLIRTERDLTQRDTALKADMPLSRYWEIENGYRPPTDAEVGRLARALKVERKAIIPTSESEVA
jgi:transcriptional regulator with XRE-family HTH domain